MSCDLATADLLRHLAPQVLSAVVRRYGHFDAAEDAVQEALMAATAQWPRSGLPDYPRGWLITVASRRLTDQLRADGARRRREEEVAASDPSFGDPAPAADEDDVEEDTLSLLFLCCHPSLSPREQIALTLRAIGGLTTSEIAQAFLVPDSTMGQRISRAKERIRSSGIPFRMPQPDELSERLAAVLHVLYLIFNEGYTATSGAGLHRRDLTGEAIRHTRLVHRLRPDDGEVAGLLALMLLTDARRPARTSPNGDLVPLADQDRGRWNRRAITEGVSLVTAALSHNPIGPYQLQAAIAAVHAEATDVTDTDWPQILALYDLLDRISDNPVITLNHAVAVAMVRGPEEGLILLDQVSTDERMANHHRLPAVRAHLLEEAGDQHLAVENYRAAARLTTSLPERRYLEGRAAALDETTGRQNSTGTDPRR